MWDFSIQADNVIEAWGPYLVVVNMKTRICKVTDFPVPGDSRIEDKEKQKPEIYQGLVREFQNILHERVQVI